LGRQKKDKAKTAQNDVNDFDVNFEDQLKKLEQKSEVKINEETLKKYDIKPVSRIKDLRGKQIRQFNGKNYEESLKLASEWRDSYNASQTDGTSVEIVDFYPQIFMSKQIIISYKMKGNAKVDLN